MLKHAQQNQGVDIFDGALNNMVSPLSTALGVVAAYYGGRHLWKGSPEVRFAAMAGLPAAIYQYARYSDPMNMIKDQTAKTKSMYDRLQKDPDSMFHNPNLLQQVNALETEKVLADYASPMRTALRRALPAALAGAALPSLLRIIK